MDFLIDSTQIFQNTDKYIDNLLPILYSISCRKFQFAALAQLVERFHGKEEVVGSSPTGGLFQTPDLRIRIWSFFANKNSSQ